MGGGVAVHAYEVADAAVATPAAAAVTTPAVAVVTATDLLPPFLWRMKEEGSRITRGLG